MAAAEDPSNPQLPAQQQQLAAQQQHQTTKLPSYPEMILAAIDALNDKNGSNKTAIGKQIEVMHPDLPAAHATLLAHHLNKMKQSGQIVFVKNNYMRPDPNAPPRRGRGRPPKPKDPLPPGTLMAPPRPRGRPPKSRDPLAPVAPLKKKSSGGSGRPRGRPPKKDKSVGGQPSALAAASSATGGAPRGRGRPPKVKPAVATVAG